MNVDKTGRERCQFLFTDLLQKTQHGAVPTGPCIAAAEAGASCLAEIDSLRQVLHDVGAMVYMNRDGNIRFKPDYSPEDILNAVNAALES